MQKIKTSSAFSVLEIVIVLTALSLLMVMVMSANKLFFDTKLKLAYKEFANIESLSDKFFTLYDQLPGDFDHAAEFWSSDFANCTNDPAPTGCNGNNNGLIDTYDESYRFWQHLYLAKLIDYAYSGVKADGSESSVAFTTTDNSKISSYVENAFFFIGSDNLSNIFEPPYGNRIYLDKTIYGYFRADRGLTSPNEALAFDIKFDDGKPRTGKINAETFYNLDNNQASPYCTNLGSSGSIVFADIVADTYNTDNEKYVCRLIYKF
jgi:hypothetical protein